MKKTTIQKLLTEKDMTVADLHEAVKKLKPVTFGTVYQAVRGKDPKLSTAQAVAHVLGTTVDLAFPKFFKSSR